MGFEIRPTPEFQRRFKALAKKYASLSGELAELGKSLADNPHQGNAPGHGCCKVRLAIQSKGRGKSGGARVITYVLVRDEQLLLLTIYDKSERESLAPGEMEELLRALDE